MRLQPKKSGKIFVISGPSGSGKTTLLKEALRDKNLNKRLAKSVSITTRPRRWKERQGKDYFFVSSAEFSRLKSAKKILESTRYLGYDYGTKKEFLEANLKQGKNLALCLDFNGARALKKFFPRNTVTIFIQPPSIKELRKRIKGRCRRTGAEEIEKRIESANAELKNIGKYDYTLKNKNLVKAVGELRDIILKELAI